MTTETQEIGDICNYYGGLNVKQEGEEFFWSIENWDGHRWSKIPKYLFKTLVRYEKERHSESTILTTTTNKNTV